METPFKVLLVEDDSAQLDRLERSLIRETSCRVIRATSPTAACNQFRKHRPEVVVMDLGLTGLGPSSGLELIGTLAAIDPTTRLIVLTGHTGEDVGIEAIKNGAASFLNKPVTSVVLATLVRNFAQTTAFRRQALEDAGKSTLEGFIGESAPMRNVYRLVRHCAGNDSNVLIVGETGTGKELVARAIHRLSPRADNRLAVYFGAAPASMAESELFGYVRGAFTGALSSGTTGALKQADKGTLFIDELCSLDLELQRKLLRAVEEKTFKPLGSDTTQQSDFRLVCAAQPRIYDLVRTGRFREDLLARVEVVTVFLPPLRERREDIEPLADHFMKSVREELTASGVKCQVTGLTKEVRRAFREYSWPRNVRQLYHAIKNGMIQAQLRGSEKIEIVDVAQRLQDEDTITRSPAQHRPAITLREEIEALEKRIITEALSRNNYTLSLVCQELGLGRTTLWRKLRSYNIRETP